MTFEEAIKKSIKAYFAGKMPTELGAVSEDLKYTREYLDDLEEKLVGKKKKKSSKKAKEKDVETVDDE